MLTAEISQPAQLLTSLPCHPTDTYTQHHLLGVTLITGGLSH